MDHYDNPLLYRLLYPGGNYMNGGAGKGDKPRPLDKKRYDENYERIFGKKKLNIMEEQDAVTDPEITRPSA